MQIDSGNPILCHELAEVMIEPINAALARGTEGGDTQDANGGHLAFLACSAPDMAEANTYPIRTVWLANC